MMCSHRLILFSAIYILKCIIYLLQLLDGTIITTTTATRQFSSQPTKHLVISSIGPDRPGILADVARIVTATGGNVGESTAQLLGGHFSLMMLVEIKSSDMDGLTKQLQNNVMGMSTSCFDAVSEKVELSPKIGCESFCFVCLCM